MKIMVGQGSCGVAAGAGKVYDAILAGMRESDNIDLRVTGCIGMCFLEPIVDIYEEEELVCRLVKVPVEKADDILEVETVFLEAGPFGISWDNCSGKTDKDNTAELRAYRPHRGGGLYQKRWLRCP